MYEFIFQSKMLTAASGGLLLVLACALTANVGFWWRVAALNVGPLTSAGFMVAILFSELRYSTIDAFAAIVFEFVILCMFCRTSFLAFRSLHTISFRATSRMLLIAALLYVATVLPSVFSSGFGVFSSGTRIDYLYEGSSAKYLTYAGLMTSVVMSGLLARRITLNRRPYLLDYVILLTVSATSILAGSKGGFILWIGAVLAFIDYGKAQISTRTIAFALMTITALVIALSVVVSEFLRITISEFFDLAFSRFFLGNDANALAFEMRKLATEPGVNLLSEMFRSFSALFGYTPKNLPIGVELYNNYFGPQGGAGANASLVALVVYYTIPGYAVLPLIFSSLVVLGVIPVTKSISELYRRSGDKYIFQIIVSLNVVLLAQDFLAFQVVLPMTVVMVIGLLLARRIRLVRPQYRMT